MPGPASRMGAVLADRATRASVGWCYVVGTRDQPRHLGSKPAVASQAFTPIQIRTGSKLIGPSPCHAVVVTGGCSPPSSTLW